MGNYHPQYFKWCLALWFIRSCPTELRKKDNIHRRVSDKMIRQGWLLRYEKRLGHRDRDLRSMAIKINKALASGEEPVYDGPFKPQDEESNQ